MPKRSTELYATFIQMERAPQEDIDFFSAVPIARPYITSDAYRPIPFISLTKSHAFSEGFFGTAINTADRIPRVLALMRRGVFERLFPHHPLLLHLHLHPQIKETEEKQTEMPKQTAPKTPGSLYSRSSDAA